MSKVRELMKFENTDQNTSAQKSIIWTKGIPIFMKKFISFYYNLFSYTEFLTYFKMNYLDGNAVR